MKKITIITSCKNLSSNIDSTVGILASIPPDSDLLKQYKHILFLENCMPNDQQTRQWACTITNKLLANEPNFRGIQQFSLFQEAINSELHHILRAIQLHNHLLQEGFGQCIFISPSWWADYLSKFNRLVASPLQIINTNNIRQEQSRFKRIISRITSAKFTFDAFNQELRYFLNAIDPFHRLEIAKFKKIKPRIKKNQLWFYSTAITYTNIGLIYEPYFPEKFNFIVENTLTGLPLKKMNRSFANLYQFAEKKFIPDNNEINEVSEAIKKHVNSISLEQHEDYARRILLECEWFSIFNSRLLPHGLYSSAIFKNWVDQVEPAALIVGNPGYEAYALRQAQAKNIPTILLQHGLLDGYHQYIDTPVDHYIVKGKFWYDQLSPILKNRALILNAKIKSKHSSHQSEKKYIVFLTAPLYLSQHILFEIDLESILCAVIKTVKNSTAQLVIRVHPLERVINYQVLMRRLCNKLSCQLDILYSQDEGLDEILNKAIAVVTFYSTVFLTCLEKGIPIISFNWLEFWLKSELKKQRIFHFANNLAELSQLIIDAIENKLASPRQNINLFIDDTDEDKLKSTINNILIYYKARNGAKMVQKYF